MVSKRNSYSNMFEQASASAPVALPIHVQQYIDALNEELIAARRMASSSAVQLVNGKRAASAGGQFVYLFGIENNLNVPADSPADLHITGRDPISTTIVAVEGLSVSIAVAVDLGGFVPQAKLQTDLSLLLKRLIERLTEQGPQSNLLGDVCVSGVGLVAAREPLSAEERTQAGRPLNAEQIDAVETALGSNVTYVQGPPGTGKSQVIGTMGRAFRKRARSVLITSHTNTAVDQALSRIIQQGAVEGDALEAGEVIRIGQPVNQEIKSDERLHLRYHADKRTAELTQQKLELEQLASRLGERHQQVSKQVDLADAHVELIQKLGNVEARRLTVEAYEERVATLRVQLVELERASSSWSKDEERARLAQAYQSKLLDYADKLPALRDLETQRRADVVRLAEQADSLQKILEETNSVGAIRRTLRGLPAPHEVEAELQQCTGERRVADAKLAEAEKAFASLIGNKHKVEIWLNEFDKRYPDGPTSVLNGIKADRKQLSRLEESARQARQELREQRDVADRDLGRLVRACRVAGFPTGKFDGLLEGIAVAKSALSRMKDEFEGQDLQALREEMAQISKQLSGVQTEVKRIEEAQKLVEPAVIADAKIVAATLTATYLRKSLHQRKFDAVIVDEASMAMKPAVWSACGLAERCAVVVGDDKQLPPIVIADAEKEPVKSSLAEHVFESANAASRDGSFVMLRTQYRMHPEISATVNQIVYKNMLRDGPGTDDESSLNEWYESKGGINRAVTLINTASLNAWVTAVNRGGRSSRLNFMSAALCAELSALMVREDRPRWEEGSPPRILVVSPYKPHAQMVNRMLAERRIAGEVAGGTAHSFQGSEADVVILDLVNDEPHWKVGMFVEKYDDHIRPLLNVAVTRARRRLVVVGDLDYIGDRAKKAFLGREFLPALRRLGEVINASSFALERLTHMAANAAQSMGGGNTSAKHERTVVTQEEFYPLFISDLRNAKQRIVMYSPFMTQNRIAHMLPVIEEARQRKLAVTVVTKAPQERRKKEKMGYDSIERQLARIGVSVVHKYKMHEKLVFLDDEIVWHGSLNPLSFSNTQEVMIRSQSKTVFAELAGAMRLDELLADTKPETMTCPICNRDMQLREGTPDPYWRCPDNDCKYSRSVGDEPLKDGELRCRRCGGRLEFGERGTKYVWGCEEDGRHWRSFAKMHCALPKMRERVPKEVLRKLGIS